MFIDLCSQHSLTELSVHSLVDVTFNPIKEAEHQAFYWEVNFLYTNNTKHCISNMLEEYAKMLEDDTFKSDSRWNIFFNILGFKTLLYKSLGSLAFNFAQLDLSWVEPSSSDKAQVFADADAVYDRIMSAYKSGGSHCVTLDEYFEALPGDLPQQLKARFPSSYATAADDKSLSELHQEIVLFNWDSLGLEANGIPFKSSFQQGPQFPSANDLIDIFNGIDALIPVDPETDFRMIVSQIGTGPGPSHANDEVAQPFQNDVFGIVVDVWNFAPADYSQDLRDIQDAVISALGSVDHRAFWGAYEDTCLECGAWEQYYESRKQYNKLTQTKRCVDPNNLFKFRMSIPTNPLNENLF
jgi:hypothetical protein